MIYVIILIALYYVVKWAVKNGINESVLGGRYKTNCINNDDLSDNDV